MGVAELGALALVAAIPIVGAATATSYAEAEAKKLGAFGIRALAWALSKGSGRLVFGTRRVSFYERPFGKRGPKITVNKQNQDLCSFCIGAAAVR